MKNTITADTIIDQDLLRQVEALCVQEEPPACSTACPLHVDVRKVLGLIQQGKMEEAYKLYAKAVPFAPIIARTCSAPCQQACKRQELGGGVQIAELEKTLAILAGTPSKAPFMLPKKNKKIAIVGAGVRGLTAANDLARKGYAVTVFEKEDKAGGKLFSFIPEKLPLEVLEKELDCLKGLSIVFEYNTKIEVETQAGPEKLLENGYDGVYLACESCLNKTADPLTLATSVENIVAGKRSGRLHEISTIYDVLDGRSAATTLDRMMQKVSILAGREKEGSYPSILYTNLENIPVLLPVQGGENGFTKEQAIQEAERCIQCECMECVKKCGFLQQFKGSPRRYVREVYNNLSIAMGNHDANGMINTCALCGQCEAICPNGLDLQQVFLAARQRMVQTGKMPQSAHEFALLDMEYSLSSEFYLAKHPPGKEKSSRVFFPGCQLAASEPALVTETYNQLLQRDDDIGLWLACCGILAKWSGNEERSQAVKEKLWEDWQNMGQPEVITACPSCAVTLQEYGIKTQFMAEVLEPFVENSSSTLSPKKMKLHHACGARYDTKMQQSVQHLATTAGIELVETSRENESPCCGYGGLVPFVNRNTAEQIGEKALEQMESYTAEEDLPYLTYCVNCRDRFTSLDKNSMHLLEIVFPAVKGLNKRNPTWSQRQQNRADLRRELLQRIWKEEVKMNQAIKLFIGAELEEKMQDTHILHSDIQGAIAKGEAENAKFTDPKTGHFITQYRPGNVTFWVEYLPEKDGFTVYNAYCHRMSAVVTGKTAEGGETT